MIDTSSLRQRKKAATKERIYLEALELFRQKGFSATTVEEIAAAADVSKGTFFNYFPSKEALLHFFGERQTLTAASDIETTLRDAGLNLRQKLSRVLRQLAQNVEADREFSRVAVFEMLKVPDAIASDPARAQFKTVVTALMAEGQKRGEVRKQLDPELMGTAIVGIYLQQVFEWCMTEKPYSLGDRLDQLVDLLWDGIGPG